MRALAFLSTLALTGLSACGTLNQGMESVHQPVVRRTDYVYDVSLGGLTAAQRAGLDGWFRSMRLGFGDHVAVEGADPTTRADIEAVTGRYGLLLDASAPIVASALPPGGARVIVSRTVANVPGCPDWSRPSQPEVEASTMSNYGCATNRNLAMMIADPQDLVEGREAPAAVDQQTSAKAIRTYRGKAPTGAGELKQESSKGGN